MIRFRRAILFSSRGRHTRSLCDWSSDVCSSDLDHFGIARQYPWKPLPARVSSHDPANWWRSLTIDRGARDGVRTNCPAVTAEGLVGRISEVGYTHARVVLLGDPDCRVAVMVGDERN